MTKNPVAGPDVQIVARLSLARGVDKLLGPLSAVHSPTSGKTYE